MAKAKNYLREVTKLKKLEILGDSILKGVMYSGENNKYQICRESKPVELQELGFEISNCSKMGATVDYGYRKAQKRAEDWDENTVVIFEYGGNDCNYNWKEVSENPEGEFKPITDTEEFTDTYKSLIGLARAHGAKVMVSTLVPLDSEKYFNWITRGLSRENILHWLGDEEMLYRWHEYYNEMVRGIAAEFGCAVLDLRRYFLKLHDFKSLICADGIHPTEKGHALIRDILTENVKKAAAV